MNNQERIDKLADETLALTVMAAGVKAENELLKSENEFLRKVVLQFVEHKPTAEKTKLPLCDCKNKCDDLTAQGYGVYTCQGLPHS